jgi:valyl-tRNA synthetase
LSRTIAQTRESLERYEFNQAAKGLYDFVWHDFCDWYLEMIKPRLYGKDPQAQAQAQRVLLHSAHGYSEALASVHSVHHRRDLAAAAPENRPRA